MTRERQTVKSNYPTPWKCEKIGEEIQGFYLGFNIVKGDRNDTFKSHKVRPEGSDECIGVSGAMIDSKIERIPHGTYVWITYNGEIKTKNGKAKDFTVECESGTQLVDGASEDESTF